MKRDRNFFFFVAMIFFIICYTTSLILANRTVNILNLSITASILVYPLTYTISILFAERYGRENAKMLFNYSILALIFMVILITISAILPYTSPDGLERIFNIDFRIVFASISSFLASHYLCLYLYDYLSGYKGFKFLIATVISITVDSLIFVGLAFLGVLPFIEVANLFIGQYVFNILMTIVYTLVFTYFIDSILIAREKEETKLAEEIKETKKVTKKTTKTKKEAK